MKTIREYIKLIYEGKIKACKDILAVCKLIEEIYIPQYEYNEKKANRMINFIENYCKHYKGKFGGKKFNLSLWQKFIVAIIFGFVHDDGTRVIREALVVVARKNGKTTFLAALDLAMLIADKEAAPECYCVATKKEQANQLYTDAYRMAQMSPQINEIIHKRKSDIECTVNFGKLKPLASDSSTLDGLNPSFVVGDEFHAWKDFNLYDVLTSSFGSRSQPLFILISTFGIVRGKVFDSLLETYRDILNGYQEDHSRIAFIYTQDSVEEIYEDFENVEKSNPNLGVSVSLEYLKKQFNRIKSNPNEKIGVLTKNFNIPQNPHQVFLTKYECEVDGFEEVIFYNQPIFVGVDHAFTRSVHSDFSNIKFCIFDPVKEEYYIKSVYLIPSHFIDENQQRLESIKNKSDYDKINYQYYIDRGDIVVVDTFQITYFEIMNFINKFAEHHKSTILKIGIDPTNLAELQSYFNAATGNDKFVIPVYAQKTIWNTPRIEKMKSLRSQHKIYCNNRLDEVQNANTIAKYDNHGRILLDTLEQRKHNDSSFAELCVFTAVETYCNAIVNNARNGDVLKSQFLSAGLNYEQYKKKRG